jgi:uncharacterized RDD family membrane protein YckC
MAEATALPGETPHRRRSLVTPEGIDLSLGLATGSQRVGAFLIDLLIMLIALIVLHVTLALVASSADQAGAGFTSDLASAVWLLGFFLIRNGYFILMEGGRRAATLGKRASGIRVVARNGERLTLESVIARNLMREIEIYLPLTYFLYSLFISAVGGSGLLAWAGAGWLLLFVLFPLFNKDRLRVGDLLAGTWVVSIPKRRLSWDLASPEQHPAIRFTAEQLDAYGVYEVQTLERVLRENQPETIQLVASTIRQKIDHWEQVDDHAFLSAYYSAARAQMERGLLFGRRRANKNDR